LREEKTLSAGGASHSGSHPCRRAAGRDRQRRAQGNFQGRARQRRRSLQRQGLQPEPAHRP